MADDLPRLPAAALDRYVDLQLLGRGGMGEVWRARDLLLARDVALKCLLSDQVAGTTVRQRLAREVRALAKVVHPNVVRVFDWVEDGDAAAIVMEYVPGYTLRRHLARGPLEPERAARLVAQAAEGLHAVHQAGLVHRDLKPENLMVAPGDQVKVMDFGLVAFCDAATLTALTRTGTLVGTPLFLPPEFLRGEPATPRCDVFQLGLVLHQALTGDVPLRGREALLLLIGATTALTGPYEGPAAAALDHDLVAIGRRAADPDPARRFPDARSFAEALRAWLAGVRGFKAPAPPPRRAPRLLATLGVVLGLAAAVLAFAAARRATVAPPPSAAEPACPTPEAGTADARIEYLRLLDDFVANPRSRASDAALRRPPAAAGAAWARREVERRLARANLSVDWDRPPGELKTIEEAATGFLGLVDLVVRLPADQGEERDRSLALVLDLTRFFEARVRRAERLATPGGIRSLSHPIGDGFVREFRAIARREEDEGRGHPALALLDAVGLRVGKSLSAALVRLEAARGELAAEPWRSSPVLPRLVGVHCAERAQVLAGLGKTDELRALIEAAAAGLATTLPAADATRVDPALAGLFEAQVCFIDHLMERAHGEAGRREALLRARDLLARYDRSVLVPVLHRPLLNKLGENGLVQERERLEAQYAETLRRSGTLTGFELRGLLPEP